MPKVIKSHESSEPRSDLGFEELQPLRPANIQKRDIIEARTEKERILEEANAVREDILRSAQQEAVALKEQARAHGYKEGKEQASIEVQNFVAQTAAKFDRIESEIEPQLRDLSLAIARKIIGKELELQPSTVINIVKQTLSDKARTRKEISLRVNPADYQLVKSRKAELIEVLSRCKEIAIREDESVSPHGCVIETDAGTIDAQLDSQLEIFERVLRDAAARES